MLGPVGVEIRETDCLIFLLFLSLLHILALFYTSYFTSIYLLYKVVTNLREI